jgi:tetratricopeptide (TPR) repeat protein
MYAELAAGTLAPEQAENLLGHAADCPACGDVLAWNLNTLQGDPSEEEAAAIAELAASRTDWQKRLAWKLAASPLRKRPVSLPQKWVWMGMTAAAVLLLATGVVLWQQKMHSPDRELALAYEQSRTLELRVPGASFATLNSASHTRGVRTSRVPAPLLEAQAKLARKLEAAPQNARWQELQARADILEERYDSAIDVLDRLLSQGPMTSELLTDAATAYFQRGLATSTETDRSTALDYLRRADEQAPDDPVVLFNEAIVMEDRGQLMNAVEVWNRYLAVERDPKWAAEGKRKLTTLEMTLNRIKSHESRMEKKLATPQAMESLASDARSLAAMDEELSSLEMYRIADPAFTTAGEAGPGYQQARGSPCPEACKSARILLKSLASSLETNHHDPWLSDLLSADIETLPPATATTYAKAILLLTRAQHEDMHDGAFTGVLDAEKSRALFHQLRGDTGRIAGPAARAGEERAALEEMYAMQRSVDMKGCRRIGGQLRGSAAARQTLDIYPWIHIQELLTEKICDDTQETRAAGEKLVMPALQLAEESRYTLLQARVQMRLIDGPELSGDLETTERMTLALLRKLESEDVPAWRFASTVGGIPAVEQDSPRGYMAESAWRDNSAWDEVAGRPSGAAPGRLTLARAEVRIGNLKEAERQIEIAKRDLPPGQGARNTKELSQGYLSLAQTMLERGDAPQAERFMTLANNGMAEDSDTWAVRIYACLRGQLDLAQGKLEDAARFLEADIHANEGKNVRGGDQVTTAEYAQLDHDLYAELAATWLAQGKSPESILALWERFRMRSRGLPITQCRQGALDCELPRLKRAQAALGKDVLAGNILLLDRVLLYRMDKDHIVWSLRPLRRQDVLDTAKNLEQAVSSPYTSLATAEKLGAHLADGLLPSELTEAGSDSVLLLEPDPMIQNLSWPVLPTAAGALGLRYPVAETRSILDSPAEHGGAASNPMESMCRRPMVVGASVARGDEPPLPEAVKEAKSVSRLLHSAQPLLGEQATAANIAQALSTATIFHFAGHAIQTRDGTELLLAPSLPGEARPWVDGIFLRQHPMHNCQLAVLSACSTGAREASWNHPLQDIVETLGDMGVPEVVATRWQIDSEASVPFMEAFYQGLAQGKNVALALTSARRVQFSQPLYGNPYYWGAYYLTGGESVHLARKDHAHS